MCRSESPVLRGVKPDDSAAQQVACHHPMDTAMEMKLP
jgi:hypothetical protein